MICIDGDTVTVRDELGVERRMKLGSPEAFALLSDLWLRSGWDTKYVYSFTWLGRPIIQLPEDIVRIQEVIYATKPSVIIETGVAHGGSLVFYASLLQAMGGGRVIGIDVEIRPHNRTAIEAHEMSSMINLIEGNSIDADIIAEVREHLTPEDHVMVVLDSNHTKAHVRAELEAYGPFVSPGSYIVACDGIMENLVGAPRSQPDWNWNNPQQAAIKFAEEHDDFQIVEPAFPFNEGMIRERVTYWPNCYLLKQR